MSEASDFPQLGRYQVVDRIAAGGMAEVFLARSVGAMGFQRPVAVKLIHANFTRDPEFVKMFIDEAKIAMHLHHRNIVQVFDLDKVEGTYFLAMEYVRGVNLYDLYERIAGQGRWIEVPMALYLVAEICKGLHFAHTRSGPDGRALGIVHRDISPQNILLSFEGEVKITDFGIATAAERLHQTAAGIVKGKYAYMAPERLQEQGSDARVDVFSAGVLLYELLVGENPFAGASAVETIEAVLGKEVPAPSKSGAPVPSRLDRIVAKALAKDPDERYLSAQALADALTELAMELTYARKEMASGDAGIAQLLAELFPEERARRVGQAKSQFQLPGIEAKRHDPTLEDTARPGTRTPPGLPAIVDSDPSKGQGEGSAVAPQAFNDDEDLDAPTLLRSSPFTGGGPARPVQGVDEEAETGPQDPADPTAPTAIPTRPSPDPDIQDTTPRLGPIPSSMGGYEDDQDDENAMTIPSGEDATAQMSAVSPGATGVPAVDPGADTWMPPRSQPPLPWNGPRSVHGDEVLDPAEHHPFGQGPGSRDISPPRANAGLWVAASLLAVAAILCVAAVYVAITQKPVVQIVEVPLQLRSTPAGATVTIDGRTHPEPTPTQVSVLGGRALEIRFTLQGHQPLLQKYTADPLRGGQLAVTLNPLSAPPPLTAVPQTRNLTLATKGSRQAEVFFEGRRLGKTPVTTELPVGTLTLEVQPTGRKRRSVTIEVEDDGPNRLVLPF